MSISSSFSGAFQSNSVPRNPKHKLAEDLNESEATCKELNAVVNLIFDRVHEKKGKLEELKGRVGVPSTPFLKDLFGFSPPQSKQNRPLTQGSSRPSETLQFRLNESKETELDLNSVIGNLRGQEKAIDEEIAAFSRLAALSDKLKAQDEAVAAAKKRKIEEKQKQVKKLLGLAMREIETAREMRMSAKDKRDPFILRRIKRRYGYAKSYL